MAEQHALAHAGAGVERDVAQIEQGRYLQPPSVSPIDLRIDRKDGTIHRVWVGGAIRDGGL